MKITIDSNILDKHGLSIEECLLLLFLHKRKNIEETIASLIERGWVETTLFNAHNKYLLTIKVTETLQDILLESSKEVQNKQDGFFDSLADKLREIFPKGSKPGTNYNWRGSTAEISRKLKNLVVKYGCKFTEEEAIEATKSYVNSFNGDYKYMKLLKYFLLKTPRNNNGDVEIESDFMSRLENKESPEEQNGNWTVDLA